MESAGRTETRGWGETIRRDASGGGAGREALPRTGVAAPLVIFNDSALGTIKSRQRSRGMNEYKLDLYPVDLAGVACACGLKGITVRSPEELEKALTAAMVADKATVIDARLEPRAYQDSFGPTIGVLN